MVDIFAEALEAEVAGLDNASVHRTDCHFVGGITRQLKEVCDARDDFGIVGAVPRVMAGLVGFVKTDGLEPGVALRDDAELFGDFAFEAVEGGNLWGQGR